MTKMTLVILTLLFSSSAFAIGWVGPDEIDSIDIAGNGATLYKNGGFTLAAGNTGCTHNMYGVFENDDPLMVDRAISASLTVITTGKTAQFYNSGCTADGYMKFTVFKVSK